MARVVWEYIIVSKHMVINNWQFSSLLKVDLAMDVEKALPRGLRKRFVPDREIIRPNQYHGFKRYWYSPPISAEDIQTALNPKKVGVTWNASSRRGFA